MPHYGPHPMNRRDALRRIGGGFGLLGLANLMAAESSSTLAPKSPHFPARAKRVIFLFMNGGMSQVDTFDPKPLLDKHHGQPIPGGNLRTERKTGNLMRSPFRFQRRGRSGIEVSEIFPHIGSRIDDICVIRSMYTDIPNHEPSLTMMNCGENLMSRPSMGSWITYGLGTENQSLPGYVVLCPGHPVVGSPLWNNSFLPAVYQGTYIPNNETDPEKLIRYIRNKQLMPADQRRELNLLADLNRTHLDQREQDSQLEASIESMEIAFRMQTEAPDAFDIRKESEATRARYGEGDFGRGCLMALRLVERGVRMVQVYFGDGQPWDNHDDILIHRKLARQVDAPVAALLEDLRARGLLDHNPYGYSIWLAGGGIKGGMTYGATDDFGFQAVENKTHVHDLHATVLYLLGLDHTKLTYRYSGRDFRLTDVHGQVIKQIIA